VYVGDIGAVSYDPGLIGLSCHDRNLFNSYALSVNVTD
jgi:hypothetical protein